eukprot:2676000-Heterocapsa_arctica.AAC.1
MCFLESEIAPGAVRAQGRFQGRRHEGRVPRREGRPALLVPEAYHRVGAALDVGTEVCPQRPVDDHVALEQTMVRRRHERTDGGIMELERLRSRPLSPLRDWLVAFEGVSAREHLLREERHQHRRPERQELAGGVVVGPPTTHLHLAT